MKAPVKKFNLRMPVDLMEEAQAEADSLGVSLNAYCLLAIRNFIDYMRRPKQQRAPAAARPLSVAGTSHKVGRNDPCPCGSGKKAKQCHLEYC